MSMVVCKLPKAGLGNMLFPLMHAKLYAEMNNLPIIITGYHQLKPGPYLRREKSKRKYSGYFNFQKNLLGESLDVLKVNFLCKRYSVQYEPALIKYNDTNKQQCVYFFEKLTRYHDYFIHLKPHRLLVIELIRKMIRPYISNCFKSAAQPVIGVHIRMGDFRKLKAGEEFRGGHVRTPLSYFMDVIKRIRMLAQKQLPVTVFTDGYPEELIELLAIPQVTMAEENPDLVDLLLLSSSKIIITSPGSTFSYWAGFLSDAPLLHHPDHMHGKVRPPLENAFSYESYMDENNPALCQYIRHL